jgi:DNA polymerase I-like protein with 3'-5' exonuclease and polymerase domains
MESTELEMEPKRTAPVTSDSPSFQTQTSFDSVLFDSSPLDNGIMELFEQEEEAQSASQPHTASIPSQIPSFVDLTHEGHSIESIPPISTPLAPIKHEKSSQGPSQAANPNGSIPLEEPHTDNTNAIEEHQGSQMIKMESVPLAEEDARSEITMDVTPTSSLIQVPQYADVPPSFVDVVSSEVEWATLATNLDSKREGFSKTVGVGVAFYDSSSNHYLDFRAGEADDIHPPDWRVVGFGLCMSASKSLPVFVRMDEPSRSAPISMDVRWDLLISLFQNPDICKYVFNAKDALKPLLERDRSVRPKNVQDPQIAAWVLSPEQFSTFSFHDLCQHYLRDKPMAKYSPYMNLARDIMLTMSLGANLEPQLAKENLWSVYLEQEMPLPPILAEMELDGILFDNQQLMTSERHLQRMLTDLEKLAVRVCGFQVNLASPKQVADVIFNKLGLRPPKNKERRVSSGRESTTEFILQSMSSQHPLPDIVLRYRHVQKFLSNWVASLNRRRMQGKLFSRWSQTAASTGRVISSKPNLQNLPRASLLLDSVCSDRIGSLSMETIAPSLTASQAPPSISVRSAFVAEPGNVFVSADFSQLEMRLLAHVSQDQSLIDFFNQGKDIHALVASKWKGIPLDKVTNEDRTAAKRMVYGIMYGMGPFSLADHLGVGIDVAKKFLAQFLSAYPGVQQFIERTKILARSRGWVRTLFGRRRLLDYDASIQQDYADLEFDEEADTMDDIWSAEEPAKTNSHLRDVKRPDRQAVNSVIQGTAADIVKRAMIRIDEELRHGYQKEDGTMETGVEGSGLRLQIHDELLYECPEASATKVAQIIKRNMENVVSFSIPLSVQVRLGTSWGDMKYMRVGPTAPRSALGFSDASYSIDVTTNNTSFGPSATHSTTQGPNISTNTEPRTSSNEDPDKLFELL